MFLGDWILHSDNCDGRTFLMWYVDENNIIHVHHRQTERVHIVKYSLERKLEVTLYSRTPLPYTRLYTQWSLFYTQLQISIECI